MSQVLLVTRPNYDAATTYLFHWSKLVLQLAKKKGNQVVDLPASKANKADLLGRLQKINPKFIFLNGHGNDTTVFGQDDEALITTKDTMDSFKNMIIYSRSCSSGKRLGPYSVNKGVKAFIGYTQPFIFIYDPSLATRPLADKTAGLFLDPSNMVVTTLIKGHSPTQADKRSKDAFRKNIQKLLTSETSKENASAVRFLFWDMKHQVCLTV